MSRAKVVLLTVLAWFTVCAVWLYVAVAAHLSNPDCHGYECWEIWPVFGFFLVPFPFLLIGLMVAIYAELLLLERRGTA